MKLNDPEVKLSVTHHRECGLCPDLMPVSLLDSHIFDEELLLVDGGRGELCRFDTFVEPFRGEVTGIADLSDRLVFSLSSLGLTITEGYVADNLFPFIERIGACDLLVG